MPGNWPEVRTDQDGDVVMQEYEANMKKILDLHIKAHQREQDVYPLAPVDNPHLKPTPYLPNQQLSPDAGPSNCFDFNIPSPSPLTNEAGSRTQYRTQDHLDPNATSASAIKFHLDHVERKAVSPPVFRTNTSARKTRSLKSMYYLDMEKSPNRLLPIQCHSAAKASLEPSPAAREAYHARQSAEEVLFGAPSSAASNSSSIFSKTTPSPLIANEEAPAVQSSSKSALPASPKYFHERWQKRFAPSMQHIERVEDKPSPLRKDSAAVVSSSTVGCPLRSERNNAERIPQPAPKAQNRATLTPVPYPSVHHQDSLEAAVERCLKVLGDHRQQLEKKGEEKETERSLPRSKLRDEIAQDEVVSRFENISLKDGGVGIKDEKKKSGDGGRRPAGVAEKEVDEGEEWVDVEREEEWLLV
jgi:hypothetical protein